MKGPDYNGLVEAWKVKLIVSRAKKMGFGADDIEDVQQEVILDVVRFRYSPAESNGAREAAALITLIDNRLRNLLRSQVRYRKRVVEYNDDMEPGFDPVPEQQRALDVQIACEALSPREKLVCQALQLGWSRHKIAVMLGCGWHTVDRIIKGMRSHFRRLGLDERAND